MERPVYDRMREIYGSDDHWLQHRLPYLRRMMREVGLLGDRRQLTF